MVVAVEVAATMVGVVAKAMPLAWEVAPALVTVAVDVAVVMPATAVGRRVAAPVGVTAEGPMEVQVAGMGAAQ